MSSIHYSRDPIKEALCQFQFAPEKKWDWTVPGLLFDKIKDIYPKKKEIRTTGVEFKLDKADISASNITKGIVGIQFINEEGTRLIQISENQLTINQLKPYNNWEEFKERITKVLNVYHNITNQEKLIRLGLRYINQIDRITFGSVLEDYFKYHPSFPDKDQTIIGPVYMSSTIPKPNIENIEGILRMIFAIRDLDPKTNISPWILDLDMMYNWRKDPLPIENVEEILEKAHDYIIESFELCITDKLRELIK